MMTKFRAGEMRMELRYRHELSRRKNLIYELQTFQKLSLKIAKSSQYLMLKAKYCSPSEIL